MCFQVFSTLSSLLLLLCIVVLSNPFPLLIPLLYFEVAALLLVIFGVFVCVRACVCLCVCKCMLKREHLCAYGA